MMTDRYGSTCQALILTFSRWELSVVVSESLPHPLARNGGPTWSSRKQNKINWSELIQWSGQLPRIIIYNVNTVELVRNILPRIIVYNVNTVDLFPSFFEKIELSQGSLFIMWKQGYVQKSSDHQTEAKNPPNYTLEELVARSYTT